MRWAWAVGLFLFACSGGGASIGGADDGGGGGGDGGSNGLDGCPAGYGDCDGNAQNGCETRVSDDAANCGACRHDCLGTRCVVAVCEALPIASAQNAPFAVTVDDANVYWTNEGTSTARDGQGQPRPYSDGSVTAATKDGGNLRVLASTYNVPQLAQPQGIGLDASNVYYAAQNGIGRVKKDGSTVQALTQYVSSAASVVVGATGASAYFTGQSSVEAIDLTSCTFGPNGCKTKTLATAQTAVGLALDESTGDLFWTTAAEHPQSTADDAVLRAKLDGTGAASISNGEFLPVAVALDAGRVYWACSGNGTIVSAARDGSDRRVLVTSQSKPASLAVDAHALYWTNGGDGTVMSAQLDGKGPHKIATGHQHPSGLAIDDHWVYWTNRGADSGNGRYDGKDGSVMKVAK